MSNMSQSQQSQSQSSSFGTQTWWELLSIQAGGTLCLPILCIGQLLCAQYGWRGALCAIAMGNGFLLGVGLIMSALSTQSRLSTFGHVREVFGPFFQRGLGLLMIISMLGWFALQINLMVRYIPDIPYISSTSYNFSVLLTLGIGTVITLLMVWGCQAMKRMALISAPLLLLGLLCFFLSTPQEIKEIQPSLAFSWEWISGISLVIGAHIAVLVDLPTFVQHARSPRDGRLCITCLYALVVPLVEAGGVWLGTVLVNSEGAFGSLGSVSFFVSGLFVLSGWSANNANLYSAVEAAVAMGLFHVRKIATIILGVLGTLLACMNPLGSMEPMLESIGVALGAMGAVMITHFLFREKSQSIHPIYWMRLLTCISYGSGVVLSVLIAGMLTTSVVLDACLIAALVQGIGMLLSRKIFNRMFNRRIFHVFFKR